MTSLDVTGLVLAGGRGRRVGGEDKGLLEIDGRPMASWVIDNLRRHCRTVLVSANRHTERYALLADGVIEDRRSGFFGPLAGLEAALEVMETPWLLLTPCDMPAVPDALYGELLSARDTGAGPRLLVADDGTRVQPLLCAVHRELLPDLAHYLDEGGRAVYGWLDVIPHERVRHQVAGGLRNRNEG